MCLEERVDERSGIEAPCVQVKNTAIQKNGKARIVRDNAVVAKADGLRLAGTDQRAQRGRVRAILDQLFSVILDLVSQGISGLIRHDELTNGPP
jgi:hypothetical protein